MAVALETVVKQLTDSGIITQGQLEKFVPPKARPKDAEELVAQLVRENHLTRFQAAHVAAGKSKSLILGGYTILDRIGAGGMGQVFKAHNRRMDRLVAIKMLPPAMTKDAAAVARFEREGRAAAKLRHKNIVATDDADQANGVHFLVMEYVEGQDLAALVKKNGPFPVAKATNYILQAARGLEFAHSEGIIHRDIKPANLLLDKNGTVKILDMGLARIESNGVSAAQAELTGTGAVMGTVDYMAPEQGMSTKHADARADIYSLGCSLYYLIAGKATYDGETVAAKLLAHHTHPIPDLRTVQPEVSKQLEAVFKKMVAKKVEDRYQTMTEVIADLERLGAGEAKPTIQKSRAAKTAAKTTPAGTGKDKQPPWKNTKVLVGASAAGFLFLLLGVWVIIRDKGGQEVARVKVPDGGTATVQTPTPPKTTSTLKPTVPATAVPSTATKSPVVAASSPPGTTPPLAESPPLPTLDSVTTPAPAPPPTPPSGALPTQAAPHPKPNLAPHESFVVSVWTHQASGKQKGTLRLYSNGRIDSPDLLISKSTWDINGNTLILSWPDSTNPKQVWKDICTLSPDGHSYTGKSNSGRSITGKRLPADGATLAKPTTTPLPPVAKPAGPTPPLAVAPFEAAQATAHQTAWAKHLGTDVVKPNSVGMQMVLIPPGEFLMGSSDADITLALKIAEETKLPIDGVKRIQEERPQHWVRITKPMRLSAHEVTIRQFAKFVEQATYKTQAEEFGGNSPTTKPEEVWPDNLKLNWRTPGHAVTDDSPVTQVSWNDAVAFCNWLSGQEQLTPCYVRDGDTWVLLAKANGYRLPTGLFRHFSGTVAVA